MWVATVASAKATGDKGYSDEQQEDVMAFLVALVNAAPALIETARKAAMPSRDALLYLAFRAMEVTDRGQHQVFDELMSKNSRQIFDAREEAVEWLRARLEEVTG